MTVDDIIIAGHYGNIYGGYKNNTKSDDIYTRSYKQLNVIQNLNLLSNNIVSNILSHAFIYILDNNKHFNIKDFFDYLLSFKNFTEIFETLKNLDNYKQHRSWMEYLKTKNWENEINISQKINIKYQTDPVTIFCNALLAFTSHLDCPNDALNAVIYYGGNTQATCKLTCELCAALHGINWIPSICKQHIKLSNNL